MSYSQLLFRSIDASGSPKRIDLLFSNVEWTQIAVHYGNFSVEEIVAVTDPRVAEFGLRVPVHGNIFLINGGPDHVTATHCQWHEDDGDVRSSSKFGPLRGMD
ncbi:hypothetical protein [Kribbella sp. NPDC023855]|uniref:hypothetical protein n=1 Tax=Kribbella sp. NPDC023855 TaxID=3154698 RepID=UPI00340699C4